MRRFYWRWLWRAPYSHDEAIRRHWASWGKIWPIACAMAILLSVQAHAKIVCEGKADGTQCGWRKIERGACCNGYCECHR